MSIRIYNTLTRQKDTFVPLEEGRVKMYVCGPTVYNYIHIGNARPAIFFDTVRRYLEHRGYVVEYVLNFTDIDDKIIQAAQEEGITAQEVAEKYIAAYVETMTQLGVKRATHHPRVTENMAEIIHFIEQLIERDLAYEANGDVYFRTAKFKDYGKLSQQRVDELLQGVRIELEKHKQSPIDFTLWKKSKPGEVSWASPWGEGRPGWHIECSTLIKKYLGDTIDIHGGGIDLSFPHHENEIAQTEGLTEKKLATYWMHNALLTIDDQKMSKSLGNFIRVNEVLQQYDPQVLRFFMLTGHYRSPINYSTDLLEQAGKGLERLKTTAANLKHQRSQIESTADQHAQDEPEAEGEQRLNAEWVHKFETEMNDDFNTANGIRVLFDLCREANTEAGRAGQTAAVLHQYERTLTYLAEILGLQLQEEVLLDEDVEQLIQERNAARQAQNFARADEIRDLLQEQGIVLEDTRQGLRWRRK